MWSTSAPERPASSSASRQARVARSASVSSPWRRRRSRMPVRRTIHSSVVSRRCSRSALVTTCSGSAVPTPKMPAVMPRRRLGVSRGAMAGVVVCSAVAAMLTQPPKGALDESGQHLARTVLDEAIDARGAQRQQRLAPAHGRAAGSRPARGGRRRTARRCRWSRRGRSARAIGVASSAARRRSAAGSISGEWKAPETSSLRARAPVSSRAASSASSIASTGPHSTSWPGRVVVGDREVEARGELADVLGVAAEHGDHAAGVALAGVGHGGGALGDEPHGVVERRGRRRRPAPRTRRASGRRRRSPSASSSPSSRHWSHAATLHRKIAGCW